MIRNAPIEEGMPAPEFTLKDQNGRLVSLRDFADKKWVILYFYPKDQTPGCTKEACSFRDSLAQLQPYNVQVLGVSVDDLASHLSFSNKYHLNFPLLADSSKETTKAYGALAFYGVARRMTFIIDPHGKIRRIFRRVKPGSHLDELSAALKALQAN